MQLRFSTRDFVWIIALAVLVGGWWLDHQRLSHDLNYCCDELEQTQEELEQTRLEAHEQGAARRQEANAAAEEIGRLRMQSAINAERPLPTPGPFVK